MPSRTLRTASTLATLIAVPAAAHAQNSWVNLFGGYSWDNAPGTEYQVCAMGSNVGVQSCSITGANGGTLTFTAHGQSSNGVLRSYARTEAVNFQDTKERALWTDAWTGWSDAFVLGSALPAGLSARVRVDYDGVARNTLPAYTAATILFARYDPTTAQWVDVQASQRINPQTCCQFANTGIRQYSTDIFDIPLVGGSNGFFVQLGAGAHIGTWGLQPITAYSESDYYNTARIGDVAFFANGVDVTSRVAASIQTASGVRYPTSAVPEPATVTLVGAGLIGLGAAARRRRAGNGN